MEFLQNPRGWISVFLLDHSSAKSLLLFINPGQSRPCFGQGAACRVFRLVLTG